MCLLIIYKEWLQNQLSFKYVHMYIDNNLSDCNPIWLSWLKIDKFIKLCIKILMSNFFLRINNALAIHWYCNLVMYIMYCNTS